jgi:hypothetical protein
MMPILAIAAMFMVAAITLFAAPVPAESRKGHLMEVPPAAFADAKLPAVPVPAKLCGTERKVIIAGQPMPGPVAPARCPR